MNDPRRERAASLANAPIKRSLAHAETGKRPARSSSEYKVIAVTALPAVEDGLYSRGNRYGDQL